MKQKKTMILLACILVALAGCYAGLRAYNSHVAKEKEKKAESEKVYLVKTDGLTSISYTDGESQMAFVQEDGVWYYVPDREVPIDAGVVEQIIGTVSSLTAVRELENPDDLADYGLTDPSYTVQYATEDGKEGVIDIGSMTGENYYAKLEDSDAVYTITDDLVYGLSFELTGFVENDTVPSISSGNLTGVKVAENGSETEYTEDDDLAELAGGWGTLSLTDLADCHVTEDTLSDYGLNETGRIQAVASYTDNTTEEEETFTVYIGGTDEDGSNRYVMVDGSALVYRVSSDIIDNMITVDDTTDTEE